MPTLLPCPDCGGENIYPDGALYICADCGREWPVHEAPPLVVVSETVVVRDANGNVLADGDSVVLTKDLRVKGSSITLKMGTRIKKIRLVEGDHEVDCRTSEGSFKLKARYLQKA